MNIAKARSRLIFIFLAFFVLVNLLIISNFVAGDIGSESLLNLLKKVLIIYSVHLGVIMGGVFGQENLERSLASKMAFRLAVIMALIWNILLAWRCVLFAFSENDTDVELANYIDSIAPASSFLVTGALTFFFTNQR